MAYLDLSWDPWDEGHVAASCQQAACQGDPVEVLAACQEDPAVVQVVHLEGHLLDLQDLEA